MNGDIFEIFYTQMLDKRNWKAFKKVKQKLSSGNKSNVPFLW